MPAADPQLVTHDATERKTAVSVRVTHRLKIVLPGRSESDHVWQIVSNDPRITKQLTALKRTTEGKADSTWEVTLVAQRPGRNILRFIWAKIGDTDVATPEELREVNVRVESLF
ncbi:MAG: hypothetical protein HZA93_12625 [Verrucomicrobia bacterium]|nr:hypothetical protein [Verrucomicrobiota bacterium]